jgi:hypothetical protein
VGQLSQEAKRRNAANAEVYPSLLWFQESLINHFLPLPCPIPDQSPLIGMWLFGLGSSKFDYLVVPSFDDWDGRPTSTIGTGHFNDCLPLGSSMGG